MFKYIFSITILILSTQVFANNSIICNKCSPTAMQSKAFSSAPYREGTYYYDVANIQDNLAINYKVRVYFNNYEYYLTKEVTRISSSAIFTRNVKGAYDLMSPAFAPITITPDSGLTEISDVFDNAGAETIIDNYIHNNHPFTYWSNQLISAYGSIFIGALDGMQILVKFPNGGSVTVKASSLSSARVRYTIISNTIIDAAGNKVPRNISGYHGKRFRFATQSLYDRWVVDLMRRATLYGANFNFSTGTLGSITTTCRLVSTSPRAYECRP